MIIQKSRKILKLTCFAVNFILIGLSSIGIALFIWGTIVLGCPYEFVFNVTEKIIYKKVRILLIWKKTTYQLEEINGFELRKYLSTKGLVKGWEIWLKLNNDREIFVARTKRGYNADKWKNALTKRFRLTLVI